MRLVMTGLALACASPTVLQAQIITDAPPSRPQGPPQGPESDGWSVTVGVAPVVGPAWLGSRDFALSIFPNVRVNYSDVLFASIPDGVGWNAIRTDSVRAGPLVKLGFGRDEDNGGSPFLITGNSNALRGLGNIGVTPEVGGFVETRFGPQRQWQVRGEARYGVTGGHRGLLADLEVTYQGRGASFIYSVGPRMTLASGKFTRTFFGIDAGQSQAAGLSVYRPGGGLLSAGVGGTIIRPIDRRSVVTLFTGVDYLGAEAGRSPLIQERGRRLQASLGIAYGFRFGL